MAARFVVQSVDGKQPSEEMRYDFEQARIVLGRGAGADIRLPHPTVSELHALVRLESDGYGVVDHESLNGTRVQGERLVPGRKRRLQPGDVIEVGVFCVRFEGPKLTTETVTALRTSELARRLFRISRRGAQLPPPRIVFVEGARLGLSVDLPKPPAVLRIGSSSSCQVVIDDPAFAPEHLELVHDLDGVLARNLDSKHTTSVQGAPIQERRLRDADEILVGRTKILFEEPADAPITALSAEPDRALPSAPPRSPEPARAPASTDTTELPSRPKDPARAPRKAAGLDADLLIYGLAAVVIVFSVLGLLLLSR